MQIFVEEGIDTVSYVATSDETEKCYRCLFDHHHREKAESQSYDIAAIKKLRELTLGLIEAKTHLTIYR